MFSITVCNAEVLYFCFHGTATTDIYTYWHPRSLHDALPSSVGHRHVDVVPVHPHLHRHRERLTVIDPGAAWLSEETADDLVRLRHERIRSEEHTSELQSLMRISYAVFCLKKKKINTYNHH